MHYFTKKGYGRIYTDKEENIEKIKQIIKSIDEFEYEYLPENFITTFDQYPNVVYTHKFDDMDLIKLTAVCWSKGIHIFCFDARNQEYPTNHLKD